MERSGKADRPTLTFIFETKERFMADDTGELSDGDVETSDNRGQWMNRVVGEPELSASFSSREEAIDAGRVLAEQRGTRHVVVESRPEGVITDPDPASDETSADADLADDLDSIRNIGEDL
jgi:hypothetical protein